MAKTKSIRNTTLLSPNCFVECTYDASTDQETQKTLVVISIFDQHKYTKDLKVTSPTGELTDVKYVGVSISDGATVRLIPQSGYFSVVFNGTVRDGNDDAVIYANQIIATFSVT